MVYRLVESKGYQKAFKKILKIGINKKVIEDLKFVIKNLQIGSALDPKWKDHALKGEMSPYRECHIRGDLLLIYRIENNVMILTLIDLGSHSQLF